MKKKYYPICPDNLWLVVESFSTVADAPAIGENESPLDDMRWQTRGIKYLYCIAPPDPGSSQAYLLSQASECHYEEFANSVIESIRGRDISIKFFPAAGRNTKDNHLFVINNKTALKPFSLFLSPSKNTTLYTKCGKKKYSSVKRQSDTSRVTDHGCCSMFFTTVYIFFFLFLYN